MFRIGLNTRKRDNFMFFDFDVPLSLTLQNTIGVANKLTPSILRGIKSGTLLDIDNAIDLEKGEIKPKEQPKPVEEFKQEEVKEEVKEEIKTDIKEEHKEKPKEKRKKIKE